MMVENTFLEYFANLYKNKPKTWTSSLEKKVMRPFNVAPNQGQVHPLCFIHLRKANTGEYKVP